jgi:hypothetical protein
VRRDGPEVALRARHRQPAATASPAFLILPAVYVVITHATGMD